jgi:hypothetical protein
MTSPAVEQVLSMLRKEFEGATVTFNPDAGGGGTVFIEPVELGPRYSPLTSWLGATLSSALPFADVYPLFVGGNVVRTDGRSHPTPVSGGHSFAGRPALQISRRSNNLDTSPDAAALKFTKVLHFFRELS